MINHSQNCERGDGKKVFANALHGYLPWQGSVRRDSALTHDFFNIRELLLRRGRYGIPFSFRCISEWSRAGPGARLADDDAAYHAGGFVRLAKVVVHPLIGKAALEGRSLGWIF